MVRGEFVVVSTGEFIDELFKSRCTLKINKFTALDTNQVVMMCSERFSELIALFEADLNNIDYLELGEKLECAVDACALGEFTCPEDFLQS